MSRHSISASARPVSAPGSDGEPRKERSVGYSGNRSGAHAGVLVAHRELLDGAAMLRVVRDLGDRGGADRGISVLPSGLRLESVEERHREPCSPRTATGELRSW